MTSLGTNSFIKIGFELNALVNLFYKVLIIPEIWEVWSFFII